MRVILAMLSVLTAVGSAAGEIYPVAFTCTGQMRGDVCWLTDARLYAAASWRFVGLPPGMWTLALEALREDPCAGPGCERDVTVQVFWREALDQPWTWGFVTLRGVEMGGDRVRGDMPLKLSGPELFVVVKRALWCEPFTGFSQFSAHLQAPGVQEVPVPPPPRPPSQPPEVLPPPPPSPSTCQIGVGFGCTAGPLPSGCVPTSQNLLEVTRLALGETQGPGDARALEGGHYAGEMGPGDHQDWYRFSVPKGEGRVVYFETFGDLVVDLYLLHDPCGTELGACSGVSGPAVLVAPCQAGVECVTFPDGFTECFRGAQCGFFVRIVRRSGSGSYHLSILPAELAP